MPSGRPAGEPWWESVQAPRVPWWIVALGLVVVVQAVTTLRPRREGTSADSPTQSREEVATFRPGGAGTVPVTSFMRYEYPVGFGPEDPQGPGLPPFFEQAAMEGLDPPVPGGPLSRVRGTLLRTEPVGGVVASTLPARSVAVARPTDGPGVGSGFLALAAGPGGEVAFARPAAEGAEWVLRRASGVEEVLAEAPGGVGRSAALGPALAWISAPADVRMTDPPAKFGEGTLMVDGAPVRSALDLGLSWLPDGRLAFVAFVLAGQAPLPDRGEYGDAFRTWQRVPAVHLLDPADGSVEVVVAGWLPLASPDGWLVARDWEGRLALAELASGEVTVPTLPPGAREPIALLEGATLVHWARVPQGLPPQAGAVTDHLSGPVAMRSILVTDLATGQSEVAVPYVDPRATVAFVAEFVWEEG